jgi:hypothetical protein
MLADIFVQPAQFWFKNCTSAYMSCSNFDLCLTVHHQCR